MKIREETLKNCIYRKQDLLFEENDYSLICCIIHKVIKLIYLILLTSMVGMFMFTFIIYAFDIYWLEQPINNCSSCWWWWFNNNSTNFTRFD